MDTYMDTYTYSVFVCQTLGCRNTWICSQTLIIGDQEILLYWAPCTRCHQLAERRKEVKGTWSTTTPCGELCRYAIGNTCHCNCGGVNHGMGEPGPLKDQKYGPNTMKKLLDYHISIGGFNGRRV